MWKLALAGVATVGAWWFFVRDAGAAESAPANAPGTGVQSVNTFKTSGAVTPLGQLSAPASQSGSVGTSAQRSTTGATSLAKAPSQQKTTPSTKDAPPAKQVLYIDKSKPVIPPIVQTRPSYTSTGRVDI